MSVVVTGVAGFVGMHVAERLLDRGESVVGIDNFNAYYDPSLKEARIARIADRKGFRLIRADIAEPAAVAAFRRGECPAAGSYNRRRSRRILRVKGGDQ